MCSTRDTSCLSIMRKVSESVNLHDMIIMWLSVRMATPETLLPSIDWIYGDEGKIYIRYSSYLDQIDLANFDIDAAHQGQGVAKSVIASCCKLGVKVVRIENIMNMEWGRKVREYQFPDRVTLVGQSWSDKMITVDFVRENDGR